MRPPTQGELVIARSFSVLGAALALATAFAAPVAVVAEELLEQLRIVAPAAPGGGWDQTARAMQQALQGAELVATPVVENVPGAAGTIGLARFIGAERGNGDALLVSGLIMLGGIVMHDSPVTLADVDPIARLTGEYEVLTVPTNSAYRTLDDLLREFKSRPESISWGGGSAGGSDQILAGLIARAVGVEPRRVNYIAFSGGGEALAAIVGGQVSVGINGLAEFASQIEAGTVRVLAISSAERLPGLDAPTLREQGVDVEFENWRSVVAPPGLSAEQRTRLATVVEAMVRSAEWREQSNRFRWLDRYLAGEEFVAFTAAEERRVRTVLRELGTADSASVLEPYPAFVLFGLALFGVAVALGSLRTRATVTVERAVGWRALGWIAVGAALYLALAERLGFVIAAALLFWFVARAFDERHALRDGIAAVSVAVSAYALFTYALELPLPAGVLGAWL
jgi:putative tricarboxylic transport membrane protein